MRTTLKPGRTREGGFTLLEVLTVVGIIGVLAAMGLPGFMTFMRNYRVRAAAGEMASEINAARLKAVTRNVNQGVVFVALSQNTYRWVVEDDQDPVTGGLRVTRDTLANLLADPVQVGPLRTLPGDIVFDTTGANDRGFRFNRFGAWCDPTGTPTTEPCPSLGAGTNYVVNNNATGATVRLKRCTDPPACAAAPSGVTARVEVMTGGRVRVP